MFHYPSRERLSRGLRSHSDCLLVLLEQSALFQALLIAVRATRADLRDHLAHGIDVEVGVVAEGSLDHGLGQAEDAVDIVVSASILGAESRDELSVFAA